VESVPLPPQTHAGEQKPAAQQPDLQSSPVEHASAHPHVSPPQLAIVAACPAPQLGADPPDGADEEEDGGGCVPVPALQVPSLRHVVPAGQYESGRPTLAQQTWPAGVQ
jgi:hypothetical protein